MTGSQGFKETKDASILIPVSREDLEVLDNSRFTRTSVFFRGNSIGSNGKCSAEKAKQFLSEVYKV